MYENTDNFVKKNQNIFPTLQNTIIIISKRADRELYSGHI